MAQIPILQGGYIWTLCGVSIVNSRAVYKYMKLTRYSEISKGRLCETTELCIFARNRAALFPLYCPRSAKYPIISENGKKGKKSNREYFGGMLEGNKSFSSFWARTRRFLRIRTFTLGSSLISIAGSFHSRLGCSSSLIVDTLVRPWNEVTGFRLRWVVQEAGHRDKEI